MSEKEKDLGKKDIEHLYFLNDLAFDVVTNHGLVPVNHLEGLKKRCKEAVIKVDDTKIKGLFKKVNEFLKIPHIQLLLAILIIPLDGYIRDVRFRDPLRSKRDRNEESFDDY